MAFTSPELHMGFERLAGMAEVVRDTFARLATAGSTALRTFHSYSSTRAKRVSRADAPVYVAIPAAPRQLALAEQWSKIAAVLVSSVEGAQAATEMQSAATQKIDLAQYGLITLVDELSAVMTMPGRSRRSATVHAFGASDARMSPEQALAA